MAPMRAEIVDELEEFIREGRMWDPIELDALLQRLDDESEATNDPIPSLLARFLRSIRLRMQLGDVPARLRTDIEAIVYPRVWKLMEAVHDGLPDGELRTRIEVMNRRLSRLFASE